MPTLHASCGKSHIQGRGHPLAPAKLLLSFKLAKGAIKVSLKCCLVPQKTIYLSSFRDVGPAPFNLNPADISSHLLVADC